MKKMLLLVLAAAVLVSANAFGQNEKFKALFIYNLTNYIDWPANSAPFFVIAVIGDSPIITELQAIAKIKKAGTKTIEVRKITAPAEIGKAQTIFVPAQKTRSLPVINTYISEKSTLVISENANSDLVSNTTTGINITTRSLYDMHAVSTATVNRMNSLNSDLSRDFKSY